MLDAQTVSNVSGINHHVEFIFLLVRMLSNMTLCLVTLFSLFLLVVYGVFGDTGEVKTVSVMEGDSVTLHTDLTHIQTNDQILWGFESHGALIAEIYKQAYISSIYVDDGRFRNRLKLNNQTGSLTITNIRITNSGLYKLTITNSSVTSHKKFNVIVYAHLSVPVISRDPSQCSSSSERSSNSTCVLLCSVMNVTHVTLSWYKGNSLFSSISVSDLNIRLSLPLEVEYQDTNTYSCVLNNPITNQTQHLHITELCGLSRSGLHSDLQWLIPVCVIALLAIIAAVGVVVYCKSGKEKKNGKPTTIELRQPANGHAQIECQYNHLEVYHDNVEDPEEAEPEISIRNNVDIENPDAVDFTQSTRRKLSDYDNCSKHCSIPWIDYESNDERGETSNDEAGYQSGLNSEAEDQLVEDVITTRSVKEGESVTLTAGDTTVQDEDIIIWKFAKSKYSKVKFKVLAKRTGTNDGTFVCNDERFPDRLHLDNQTGSLTITDFRDEDTGHYKLLIPGKMFLKTFIVNKRVSTLQRRSSNNW